MKVSSGYRSNRVLTLAGALAVTLCSGVSASPPATSLSLMRSAPAIGAGVAIDGSAPRQVQANVHTQRSRYTVILKAEPVATYDGLVAGYPKISRNAANGRLNVQSQQAVAYASHLVDLQNQFLGSAGSKIKRPVDAVMQFQHAINGVVVELSADEAAEIATLPDVLLVDSEKQLPLLTDRSPIFIGADQIWDGSATGGLATQGEGIVIGDIDTGINYTSPAFAGVGPLDGYQHVNPLGSGNYLGLCQPSGIASGHCNDKLIGIYDFVYSLCTANPNSCGGTGNWAADPAGTDVNGHGTHTSSTAAGNHASVDYAGGTFTIQGVAPHATLIEYTTCYTVTTGTNAGQGSCPSTATTAAVNRAVADGIVDVLTFSIGGGSSPWTDSTSMAFLGAQNAGIFVSASAGNSGPVASTIAHLEPWVETVAASTDDQVFGYTFNLTAPGTPPANTLNLPVRPGANPQPTGDLIDLPITQSPGFANGSTDGCSAFANNHTFDRDMTADRIFGDGFDGTPLPPIYQKGIAVLHLDGTASNCGSVTRRANALNAGAAATIFVDTAYLNLGASGTTYAMLFTDWNHIYSQIVSDPSAAAASVQLPLKSYLTAQGDVIADFSSRGPAAGIGGQAIVKPEIAAPGVAILAAYMGAPGAVAVLDGTSMAAPHIAGSGALLRALHPQWTPTQIRSAMMLTAKTSMVNQDNSTAGIWDRGSGRIDLAKAANAGLILDETGANYLAANPATGGKISTLNIPSIADNNCVGTCNYTRTVQGAHAGAVTYTLSVDGFPAGAASVAPANLLVPTGGKVSFTVTVHGDQLASAQYQQGQVTFTPSNPAIPVQHMPVAIQPGGPAIQVSPASVTASAPFGGTPVTQLMSVTNIGNPTLNWAIGSGASPVTLLNSATTSNGEGYGAYADPVNNYYGAQNFDVTGAVNVTTLRANGFIYPSGALTAANTSAVSFSIYGDAAGVPNGAPQNIGAAPLWTYSAPIGGAGLSVTGGNLSLDLTASGVPALNLGTGRYWFVPFPTMLTDGTFTAANPGWAWRTSSDPQIGNPAKDIYPAVTSPAWANLADGSTLMSAFIKGNQNCTQPSWVSYAPSSGALGYNGVNNVTVTFDPTGLFAGTYNGTVCIVSNATNATTVVSGLTFTVTGAPPTAPSLSAGFSPNSIATGGNSTLTLDLGNSNTLAATLGADFIDSLPAGLVATSASTTCGGGAGASLGSGGSSVILGKNAQIPANSSCSVTATVTSSSAATYTNSIPAGALQTNAGNAAAASASLTVTGVSAPAVSKAFAPASIVAGGSSTLTLTLSNNNASVATLSANMTDTFPTGMVSAAAPSAATTCTGGVGVSTSSGSITLGQNATIPANGSCTVSVNVTAAMQGSYANQIAVGALATNFGSNTTAANATLTVTPDPFFLYSNLTTDANASVLNGATALVSGTRYTPMVCNKLTLAQPGQQLITSFSVWLKNANATSQTPTTRISFYDDSGSGGAPGIKLGNTNQLYYGGGNYGAAIASGSYMLNAAPFGYTATYVPAPTGGGNANVWACVQYSSATLTDTVLSNLGLEKFANAPTAGSTTDAMFVTTSAGSFTDNPAGTISSNPASPNVFGWELKTLGNVPLVDSYQVASSSTGAVGTSGYSLNPAAAPGKNFNGYATAIEAPTSSWNVTGVVLYPQCSVTRNYVDVKATVQFWDTFNGSTATPVFSNSAPIASSTVDLGPVNCTANTFQTFQARFPTPINVGSSGKLGMTVQYTYDSGTGPVASGDVTSVMNNAPAGTVIAVGTNASPGAQGWYASNSNRADLDFQSGDYVSNAGQNVVIRVYGRDASLAAGAALASQPSVASGNDVVADGEVGEPVLKATN